MKTLSPALIPLLLIVSTLSLLAGCATVTNQPQLTLQQHKLVGKIWDVKQQAFINRAAVIKKLQKTNYLLLGERHDNPVHHQHQAWFIRQLKNNQQEASVAFEMIDNVQAKQLAQQSISSAGQMIRTLNNTKTNWQYERRYQALFGEVIAAGYQINAANISRQQLMHMVMHNENKLPPAYQRMLNQAAFSKTQENKLQYEINQSHCNLLDDNSSKSMLLGQRLRDATMAHSLLKSQSAVSVLIAGLGHARNDLAVPVYIDSDKIMSVGFIEVEQHINEPAAYAKVWNTESLPFDIVWFTPQVKRKDMCEQIKQHFKNKATTSKQNL
ncbi:MAG: ChaN family lipoprotein [Gammaproteobacteria bacterium]|nr:ChaN family lipoprotein [Gammaproteobacteria bacterium]